MVGDCLSRGHKVTLFNRGCNIAEFPELETIVGDRDPEKGEGLNGPMLGQFSNMLQARAVRSGFVNRPFRDTVVNAYNWWMSQSETRRTTEKLDNFPMAREADLLKVWDEYQSKS